MTLYEGIKNFLSPEEVLAKLGVYPHREVGDRLWYCCPIHKEATASFKVENGRFNCFGCNAYGDVIDLLRALISPEPVKFLDWLKVHFGFQRDDYERQVTIRRPKTYNESNWITDEQLEKDRMSRREHVQIALRLKQCLKRIALFRDDPPDTFNWAALAAAHVERDKVIIEIVNFFIVHSMGGGIKSRFLRQINSLDDSRLTDFYHQPDIYRTLQYFPGNYLLSVAGVLQWDDVLNEYIPAEEPDRYAQAWHETFTI